MLHIRTDCIVLQYYFTSYRFRTTPGVGHWTPYNSPATAPSGHKASRLKFRSPRVMTLPSAVSRHTEEPELAMFRMKPSIYDLLLVVRETVQPIMCSHWTVS